jgi:flagellar motor switch protein FliN/FliY
MNNDVFDEDLMRELGLDPNDIESMKTGSGKKTQAPAASAPARATATSGGTQAPQRSAPKTASSLETSFSTDIDLEDPSAETSAQPAPKAKPKAPKIEEDLGAYGEKMTQNIPVHLAAVLAKQSIALKDVIEMRPGEVIDFKKNPQEPIDLVVNGKLVAKAELVLVDGKIGARIVKLVR